MRTAWNQEALRGSALVLEAIHAVEGSHSFDKERR
jgi:hypothetical protein